MRSINKLTREEAISIVQMIQRRLYLDTDGHGAEFLNPDKDWNGADVCQDIAAILVQYGLVPDTLQPAQSEMEHPLDELFEYAEQKGLEPVDLDDFVHDVASNMAASNYNAGLKAQIGFLVDTIGFAQTRKELENLSKRL